MAERSFVEEVKKLRLGAGETFRGEGILAVTKALLESGVAYVAGYQGAPISHLMDVLADAQDILAEQGIRFENSASEATAAATLAASVNYPLRGAVLGSVHFVAFINIHNEIIAREELSRLNENKNRILSILSHDLRTPLNTLHGTLRLLSDNSMTEEEKSEILRKTANQVFHLREFLDTTLHWSRTNFQDMVVNEQPFDAKEIVENILSLYVTSSINKKIRTVVSLEYSNAVHGDPGIFSIVFRNLISNAIKFTPINGTIRVYDSLKQNKYTLSVENSGNGISQKKISEILNGTPSSEPGTSGEKGLGLGLNLCLQLLRKSGGSLEIENIENRKAIFKIVM